jgi:hypothetical protein
VITSRAVCPPNPGDPLAEAHLAAAAFLARCQGRTLDALEPPVGADRGVKVHVRHEQARISRFGAGTSRREFASSGANCSTVSSWESWQTSLSGDGSLKLPPI